MGRKRILIGLLLLVAGLAVAKDVKERRAFTILGRDGKNFILQPMVAPIVWVKKIEGPNMPENGSVHCEFKTGYENGTKVVNGYCEKGIVIQLTGIDLNH
jgi:hypothetical protein